MNARSAERCATATARTSTSRSRRTTFASIPTATRRRARTTRMTDAADSRPTDWVEDESICPCGAPAGPDFRYGLCDRHARAMPPEALLRFGVTTGRLLKEVFALT